MTIAVARTLDVMADVYRRPVAGGPRSERFRAYVDAGTRRAPVHGYNPMTSKPVLATVEALLDARAEDRLDLLANQTARHLDDGHDDTMHITVATPGMWTDRLATEVEHRLLAPDPGGVLWWFEQPVTPADLDSEIVAQTVRLVLQRRSGPPATLADAVRQEALAGAMAGQQGQVHAAAADAMEVLAGDTSLATMVGFLYGDAAAAAMGFTPLGLDHRVGYEHAIALAPTLHEEASTSTFTQPNG